MTEKEQEIKAKAFGTIEKIKADFNHKPSVEKLLIPLEPGAGLQAFCWGCGTYFQIDEDVILYLEDFLNKPLSPSEYYADSQFCPFCDSTNKDIQLRKISELLDEDEGQEQE